MVMKLLNFVFGIGPTGSHYYIVFGEIAVVQQGNEH